MKDETQKAREALEKIISEKKQNKNEVILESLKETIETALKAMNLTELHKALRENSKFTGSKMMLANWLDAQGMRKKRPVAAEAKAARVRGRLEAKAARAEQPKETPQPAPAPHVEAAVERPAPERVTEKPLQERPVGNPVSMWGDGGEPRCPECNRRIRRHQNKEGLRYWRCEHCNNVFADDNGKIGGKYLQNENGSYYLPPQE